MSEIRSESIDIRGQKVVLVSVKDGENAIGTCTMGASPYGGMGAVSRLLFVGNEPILNITCPNNANKKSDKIVSICPGFRGYDQKLYDIMSVCFTRLNQGETLVSGMKDIFSLLQDGVYAIYTADYYPTNGNGSFFWGGYNVRHEIKGSAEQNAAIGDENLYKPCFLMPTQSLDYYTAKALNAAEKEVKSRLIQGIVYHVSGFHSALLKGFHGAVACVKNNIPYKCAVIEKICDPYTDRSAEVRPVVKAQAPKSGDEGADGQQPEQETASQPLVIPVSEQEGITGFRSPSVKIPIELFPKDMLKVLLSSLSEYKPPHFGVISAKLEASGRKKAVSNNVLPLDVLEKAEQMPDASMVESAYAVPSLSDEELNCLLAGDVEHNGRVIISPNFYASIVTACNFLQFTDMKRFIDFSIAIMDNPELSATHEYVAQRVSLQEKNTKLYNFFKTVRESRDEKYEKILSAAYTFTTRYEKATAKR